MIKQIGLIISLTAVSAVAPVYAADGIKSYTTTLFDFDDRDSRNKKIRLIYSLENVWNTIAYPNGHKEVRFVLSGGSGFDMTGVPNKREWDTRYWESHHYYTLPTAFKLGIRYEGGSKLRHMNHKPETTIGTATVSESLDFNLGLGATASGSPSIGLTGGISKSRRITYEQKEFETIPNFKQDGESIEWLIEAKSIGGYAPVKQNLIYSYTNCYHSNLKGIDKLPSVMRSDFRPQVGAVYRKDRIYDGDNSTQFKLTAGWRKSELYFWRDWCSWWTVASKSHMKYKDRHTWTSVDRYVTVRWMDSLYH